MAVSAGYSYSLTLKSDGSIVKWGTGITNPPAGNDYVAIAAGYWHGLALKSDGSIVGWGYGPGGPGPDDNDFNAIAAGGTSSLGVKRNGTIVGWDWYYDLEAPPPVIAVIVEKYSYEAFGEPNGISWVGNRYRYTGREYEPETGLYYYRARYYSPKIGRFLRTDPIGYEGGLNLYTYCGNNPLNWIDPWGLRHYKLEATQRIIGRMRSRFYNPILHGIPEAWGGYATGDNPTSAVDTYTIPKQNGEKGCEVIGADQFGNYLAGYGGTWNYGLFGYLGMREMGNWYHGWHEQGLGYFQSLLYGQDDPDSIKYINRGAADAVRYYLTPKGYLERLVKKGLW